MSEDSLHQITHLTLRTMQYDDMIMEAMFVAGRWCQDHGKPMTYTQISEWIVNAKKEKGIIA